MRLPRTWCASPVPNSRRICVAEEPWWVSSRGGLARGKGIDDHLAIVGPDAVIDEIAHVDFASSSWRKDLLRARPPMNNSEGRILPVLANAIAAFRHSPEWGGVLGYNEFALGTVALKPTPWGVVAKGEWTDHEDR